MPQLRSHIHLAFTPRMVKAIVSCIIFVLSMVVIGCGAVTQPASTVSQPTKNITTQTSNPTTEISPSTETSLPEPSASPTSAPISVWLSTYLPEKLRAGISLPEGFTLASSPETADLTVQVDTENPLSRWVYALVAPFPTIPDGMDSTDIKSAWSGKAVSQFKNAPILMDESTLETLTLLWGEPAEQVVKVLPDDQLVDYAWANRPAWAIIPFESLEPRWKVLAIDGQSPIQKGFDASTYLLNIPFGLSGKEASAQTGSFLPATNRQADHLATVAMTGVTAMVRATAYTMEKKGITYPAEDIGSLLSAADLTHISNEIPFWPDCPAPALTQDTLVFCSNPSYIDLLKAVGTDIVELTGDHFMDYGAEATLYTLQMYQDQGWPYYGGGANAEEARQPVKTEINGNMLAFMGCNVGCEVKNEIPCDAIATEDHPGAAQCDFDYIRSEIPVLSQEGYDVIFTFQHREYYTYTTEPILANDFGLVAAAGATIVSGSQAHQPHGFSFKDAAFIHYGLGNLFFDQYHYCADYACDNAFIDRHVFYEGRHLSTELITIKFVDSARPRLMTPDERAHFLETIFRFSRW